MTPSALSAAIVSIDNTRRFLRNAERKVEAVRQILDVANAMQGAAQDWANEIISFPESRTYDYVCAVVLLYGALERFVEEATDEQVAALVRATSQYASLPEKMRSAHFDQAISHLQRTRDKRYDGAASAQQLSAALSGCLSGTTPYSFITESILYHTSNFRPQVVDDTWDA